MQRIANRPRPPGDDVSWIEYDGRKFSSFGLNDKDHDTYRECSEAIVAALGGRSDSRVVSAAAVDSLLQKALVTAAHPTATDTNRTRTARVTRAVSAIRKTLEKGSREWRVVTQIFGIHDEKLPFVFGAVTFHGVNANVGARLAEEIPTFAPRKRTSKKLTKAEGKVRGDAKAKLREVFATTCAEVAVSAHDGKAASRLGLAAIRRVVDCLNFFGRQLDMFQRPRRIYLAPDGPRTSPLWAAQLAAGGEIRWSEIQKPREIRGGAPDPTAPESENWGLGHASRLLASTSRTDFEERIITAISWAGRAAVEERRDQAFIFNAIALESLLTKPSSKVGVTDRFRLRAAHLLGRTVDGRRRLMDRLSKLYDLRSNLVHNGDSGDLTDNDLTGMARFTARAIQVVLTDKRFDRMNTAAFDRWCEDSLLAGQAPVESPDT